jgi:signal transduction histidine kinase
LGAGNLEHRVPLARSGEFRDLAASFNTMAERVGETMHAKERLLLDVSHELRSPITRMKVALEFMQDGQVKESIREDLKEMEEMVSDILETYRRFKEPGALNLKLVDLAGLIHDAASGFDPHPPGIDASHVAGALKIKVDPEKIKTVLQNVMVNGLKYSEEDADPIAVTLEKRDDWAVVEVQDHGIGIPEDAIPYLFEPFYRVDTSRSRKTGGYGLGLSLSKAIMEAHGGRIEIESREGEGTTVTLFLPLKEPAGR